MKLGALLGALLIAPLIAPPGTAQTPQMQTPQVQGPPARAAVSRGVSYSVWSLDGQRVTLRFILPASETRRISGTDIALLRTSRFGEYLLDHVAVRAAGQPCPAIDQGYDIGRVDPLTVGPGLDGFEIFFQCTHPSAVVLENHALFERLPGTIDFARVQVNGGPFREQLFTAGHPQLHVPDGVAVPSAGIARYARLGAGHVLGEWDRWCFLLGALLLLAGRGREVGRLIAALAAGYALSLPAALFAPIIPRAALPDAFVGLLVALLAMQSMARYVVRAELAALIAGGALLWAAAMALLAHATWPALVLTGAALFAAGALALDGAERTRTPHPSPHPAEPAPAGEPARANVTYVRAPSVPLLAALFGFLDGFILPGLMQPLQLPARSAWPMLLGFDVGTLLAEATVLLLALLAATLAMRWARAPLMRSRALAADAAAAALGGLGVFWLISRL